MSRFLLLAVNILILAIFCNSQKLVCRGEEVDDECDFDHVFVTFANTDSKKLNFSDPREFDPSRKTVLIIHGASFGESYQWAFEMGKKWLEWDPANVIIVKWTMSFVGEAYKKSALSTEHVAAKIKDKITELKSEHGPKLNTNFHLVGHSLGAHIAGQSARSLKEEGTLVPRVTGLDPAYPCFESESASLRLRKSDAEFVDVYHTNCEPGDNVGNLGIYDLIGHVDFYLNGGNVQPEVEGCKSIVKSVSKTLDAFDFGNLKKKFFSLLRGVSGVGDVEDFFEKAKDGSICNHAAAYNYFIESLDPNLKNRWANPTEWPVKVNEDVRCQNQRCNRTSCIQMGINADSFKNNVGVRLYSNLRRAFFVDTWNSTSDCPESIRNEDRS